MKTDDLIAMLATGPIVVAPHGVTRRFALGLSLGAIVTIALMVIGLGLRPDLGSALAMPMFWVKILFAVTMVSSSLLLVSRLSRPGTPLGRTPLAMASPLITLWLLGSASLITAVPAERRLLLLGETWTICPWLIAGLAVPLLIATLWIMAGLAPVRLRLAGAAGGLLAGALSVLIYSLHCPEMGAPFIAVWYVLGMLMPALVGALLGPRLLRW